MPAVVFVMMTLPPCVPIDRRNETTSHPIAGASPPPSDVVPQAPNTQVTKMITTSTMAITGTGDWPYWKLPIRP